MSHRTVALPLVLAASAVAGLALLVAHRASKRPLQPDFADASPPLPNQAPTVLDYIPPPANRAPVELDPTSAAPDPRAPVCQVDFDALLREAEVPATHLVCRVDLDEMLKEAKLPPSQSPLADAVRDRLLMDAAVRHARQVLEAGK